MDPMTSHLDQTFGSFPEPVLLLDGDQVIYANEPGQALLQEEAFPAELLAALAEHPGSAMETWERLFIGSPSLPMTWGCWWSSGRCRRQRRNATPFPMRCIGCGSACPTSLQSSSG